MWYCAHAILFFEYEFPPQDHYVVWEHLYLIEATTPAEAHTKAEARARQDESGPAEGLRVNDRPARLRVAGIRKVVECRDLTPDGQPGDGTELSYSELFVSTPTEFHNLVAGDPADVSYSE
jgi:hypothetical protein